MSAEQIDLLLGVLQQILFVLQTALVSLCYIAGIQTVQLIIHSKNQRNLL